MEKQSASQALAYPATIYAPPALPDLSRPEERRRLSPAALRAFFNILEHWEVREEDARQLLRGISNGAFYEYKRNPNRVLDEDRLRRISYLIGIFKALNILYGTRLADKWVQLENTNPLFGGKTPLTYMLQGGTQAMAFVRQLLDARRGG
ncbi:antitoxin Xre/MbcA/ParS toxin-binding domain-containing protein [Alloacidobacterium sp.]|uniref:antitoxin Xre/MbcA/ParS toxin-binding domain-containing protein n=1 Tax=Alloacidobacterium sp. TaxID=2951999 RepID=UPI002D34B649|nr:antitoxin Xre/MbcA/ParS toxin-binding domain-containing protein [Alloacidobacterium sp.]HYK37349.1 antitoxin Xre/MbcA/ParS toxin-binding domain-containing protein [Alloacidobacterium sp.]